VNKTVAAAQLANHILLHAFSRSVQLLQLSAMRAQTKTSFSLFNGWHNSIFGYKLRTDN